MSFRTVRPLISSFSARWAPDHSRRDSSRVRRRSRRADVLSTLSDLASYCGTYLAAIADSLGSLFVGHFGGGKSMTQGLSKTSAIMATLGVALALLLAALDQTVVGVAMPRIVSELHGLQYYAWVTTAYLITSTALVPVAGKLGDMFGRKPFLLAAMVGFIAASALCGTSFNMASLVA